MHKFYFNECLPNGISQPVFTECLATTLEEFKDLLEKDIDIESAVITHQLPSESTYSFNNANYSLLDVIDGLPSDEIRNFAYAVFNRYPLGAYFDDTDEVLILQDWFLTVSGVDLNALNLAIVAAGEGVAFSLPLAVDLKRSPLAISERTSDQTRDVWNLFGEATNTTYLVNIITDINAARLGLFAQLKVLLGDCVLSAQFTTEFGYLTIAEQRSILTYFNKAIDRNLKTRFYPDTKIVKDVTPESHKCRVYELRIYLPTAIRVYFNEGGGKVYLSSIGYKNRQQQSSEIASAHNTLYKMTLTNK